MWGGVARWGLRKAGIVTRWLSDSAAAMHGRTWLELDDLSRIAAAIISAEGIPKVPYRRQTIARSVRRRAFGSMSTPSICTVGEPVNYRTRISTSVLRQLGNCASSRLPRVVRSTMIFASCPLAPYTIPAFATADPMRVVTVTSPRRFRRTPPRRRLTPLLRSCPPR